MNLDSVLQTFFAEADELLVSMESALLRLEDDVTDSETINEIFRAAHTIKGSAGLFGFEEIVAFTHKVENVLDLARDGVIKVDSNLLSVLLPCRDHIATLIDNAMHLRASDQECIGVGETLVKSLEAWLQVSEEKAKTPVPEVTSVAVVETGGEESGELDGNLWLISLKMGQDLLRNGMDPLSIFRYLNTLGKIESVVTRYEFPSAAEFDAESIYLTFELGFTSNVSLAEIENAFLFIQEDSEINIVPPRKSVAGYLKAIKDLPDSLQRLGEILVKSQIISYAELEQALAVQKEYAKAQEKVPLLGSILVETKQLDPTVIDAALEKQRKGQEKKTQVENKFIRVDAERLDLLINLIGELVINRQRVDLLSSRLGDSQLMEAVTTMGNFTEQIRDAALTLRMVPIGDTFQKFKRVVRDTAKELGKEIELEIYGAETELDRSMVERLNDPLTHIVRNAMDHGIEATEFRIQRGKPALGTITLGARHDAGNIVITISDDGGGLNTEKIRAKAIANGILDESAILSQQELFQLIFHPGLSTAEKVTNLSGRGVGMDVVKRNIEALQGGIEIESELGVGTALVIRLPLTLAIIDGFHVATGNTNFIIPQNTILECVDLNSLAHVAGQDCVNLRGEQVPFIRLRDIFALPACDETREKIVVVQFGDRRAGIVVDELHGEIQTVVKPMGPIFQALKGIGGSSLLGTGEVALILDVQQLINFAIAQESARNGSILASLQE